MEEFNIQGKQTSFYKYCPGTFEYTLVFHFAMPFIHPFAAEFETLYVIHHKC